MLEKPEPGCSPESDAQDAGLGGPSSMPPGKGKKALLRVAILVLGLVAAALVIYLSPLREWLPKSLNYEDLAAAAGRLRHVLDPLGNWSYPVTILAITVLVGMGAPRLFLCGLGGMIFGFWAGLSLTTAGTLLGYYGVFLFVRWGGRDMVLHRWPQLQTWADKIHNQGTMGVILARQLPLPGTLMNLCLGLTRLRHRPFLIGTAVGLFPEAVPCVLFGAGMTADRHAMAKYAVIAIIAFVVIAIGCRYLMKKIKE